MDDFRISGSASNAGAAQFIQGRGCLDPTLLTKEFEWLDRKTYINKFQPLLAGVTIPILRSALGISQPYAAFIRSGKRVAHPRHWQKLGHLVGLV